MLELMLTTGFYRSGVWLWLLDSTADMRYLVLPRRPPDHLTEEELAQLATRDSMIGTAVPKFKTV